MIAVSASIANRVDTLGVSRLAAVGGTFGVAGYAAVGSAPTLAAFLLAHVLVGIAVAFGAPAVRGADEQPVRIQYEAHEGCPDALGFFWHVRARTHRVRSPG